MCDQCGISWRKYGDIRSGRIEEPKKSNGIDKRENTPQPPVKRTKVCTKLVQQGIGTDYHLLQVSISRGPSPPPAPRQHICCCCKKSGPVGRVVQCGQCGVQVHAGECCIIYTVIRIANSILIKPCMELLRRRRRPRRGCVNYVRTKSHRSRHW
jgi:hypothetical protein